MIISQPKPVIRGASRDEATGLPNRVIILHKEDKPLGAVAKVLKRDYVVEEYDDADVAAKSAMGGWIRAVFVDTELENASGLRLLKQLPRKQYGRPPILLVGPKGDPRLQIARFQELADTVLEWPCKPGNLLGHVWRLLDMGLESFWDNLPPIQRDIMKNTRKTISRTLQSAIKGEEIQWSPVIRSSAALVDATRSGDMQELIKSLKASNQLQYVHALRVATNMTLFGASLNFPSEDIKIVAQAGLMHDLGMQVLPSELTNKPEGLDSSELAKIKKHPLITEKLLGSVESLPQAVLQVALNHHEMLDGGGYPHGRKGNEIDNLSLICAMADTHAALTSRRPHRSAMTEDQAFKLMREQAGTKFDAAYLRHFENVIRGS